MIPKKHDVLERAKEIAAERQIIQGLPVITPTEQELKESGVYEEAKIDLMTVNQDVLSQQREYLEGMASEMKLAVIPERGLSQLKREHGIEWTNGWTVHKRRVQPKTVLQVRPKPIAPAQLLKKPRLKPRTRIKAPKRKRKKRGYSNGRSGRTRKDGRKGFSLLEWKVR